MRYRTLIPLEGDTPIANDLYLELCNEWCEGLSLQENLLRPLTSSAFPYISISSKKYFISLEEMDFLYEMIHHVLDSLLRIMMHTYRDELIIWRICEEFSFFFEEVKKRPLIPMEYLIEEWMLWGICLEVYGEVLFFVIEDLIIELLLDIIFWEREIELEREKYHSPNISVYKCRTERSREYHISTVYICKSIPHTMDTIPIDTEYIHTSEESCEVWVYFLYTDTNSSDIVSMTIRTLEWKWPLMVALMTDESLDRRSMVCVCDITMRAFFIVATVLTEPCTSSSSTTIEYECFFSSGVHISDNRESPTRYEWSLDCASRERDDIDSIIRVHLR